MMLKRTIINYVYNKKISYLLHLKISFIKYCTIYFIVIILSSCSFIETVKDIEVKVTKVGQIISPANYILIYPKEYNNSLSYTAIIDKIISKLVTLGFTKVSDKSIANYAFIINFEFLNKGNLYKSKKLDYENSIINMAIDNIVSSSKYKTLIFDAYLIHNNNIHNKVFEGNTIQIDNIKTFKELDKGTLGFIMCSIDALFDSKVNSSSDYQEYYYKCL